MTERPIAAESATMTRVRVFETLELLRARYTRQRFAPHEGWSYRTFYPGESLVRFIAREVTGRDFSPTFDGSFVVDVALSQRLRAAHMLLESSADGMQK